jgi:phage terminase large subunit
MLQKTTAQNKIAQLKKRVRIVRGGTSSSKTFSIIPMLITYAVQKDNTEISIVSESIPHLRRGAIRDFLKIMQMVGMYDPNKWNKSSLTYTFSNNSFIEFFSADQPDKLRGARRDVLFINECNNVDWESYYQLAIRTRKFIYLDYNPVSEFWVDTELIGDNDSEMIILTYKDNEALDPSIVAEIEKAREKGETSSYWANWFRVYGLGQIGNLEGVIFSNYQLIDTIPDDARLLGCGVDFGYSVDPTAIVEVYQYNDQRIIKEICYRTGMLNSDIAKVLPKGVPVYADSAEPKSIEEIRRFGISIKGVTKGKDSINYGIQVMQGQNYMITKDSTNLIKELRGYCWDKGKDGKTLPIPVGDSHLMDAWRYFEMESLGLKKNFGVYDVR